MSLCPVCGFRMKYDAEDFRICSSCGTEFGYDDSGVSHEVLRERWRLSGLKWWSPVEAKPDGWDPYLHRLGLRSRSSPNITNPHMQRCTSNTTTG